MFRLKIIFSFFPKRISNKYFSTVATNLSSTPKRKSRLYQNLFPWKNDLQLAQCLASNVVYNENGLIVINKPWGVGIYRGNLSMSNNRDKPNLSYDEQFLNSRIFGQTNVCVADALDLLSQILNLKQRLHIVKSLHRDWSGLLLLSVDESIQKLLEKSIRRAKTFLLPYMSFYCIVNGIIPNAELRKPYLERCGIRLTEIDKMGKFKEPIYIPPNDMTNNMRKRGTNRDMPMELGPVKPVTVRFQVLAKNPELAVSLIQVETTATKWRMLQCFLAYKTSFILGDTFFSYRVKHILGQPMTMATLKQKRLENWKILDQNFEPLSKQVSQALSVRSNREIPLMIHHNGLVFPKFLKSLPRRKQSQENSEIKPIINSGQHELVNPEHDLIIKSDSIPDHFQQTLERLNLKF